MQKYNLIVVLRDDEVLMQFKLRGPFPNMWNPPGGKIEINEDVLVSTSRELKEETGIEMPDNNFTYLAEIQYHHVCPAELHLFSCRVNKDIQFIQKEDEPLAWIKTQLIIENKLPTAGHLSVPHFVQLVVEYYKNLDKQTGGAK